MSIVYGLEFMAFFPPEATRHETGAASSGPSKDDWGRRAPCSQEPVFLFLKMSPYFSSIVMVSITSPLYAGNCCGSRRVMPSTTSMPRMT